MNLGLNGKFALVTGASRGIGRCIALSLAEEGCHVAICARKIEKLQTTAEEVRKKGVQCLAVQADVRNLSDIQTVYDEIAKKWGTLHILVNNAGGTDNSPSPLFEETPEAFWIDIYNRNALAAIRFTNFALPYMRKQKWGRIITIISKQGREGGGKPWYTMAKAAEMAFMKTMSMNFEIARDGVTFNSVAPGAVLTEEGNWADFLKENPEKLNARLQSTLPLGRLGLPEEIASVVTFICSEKASLLSGASIPVDGGESKAF